MKGRVGVILLLLVLVVAACGGARREQVSDTAAAIPARAERSAQPSPDMLAAPTTSSPEPRARPHVFVVVMENTGLERALASPWIARLASTNALATSYRAVARPSLPNYLALASGSTWGVTDNGYRALPATGIGAQLTGAGIPWRAYMEGMTSGCMRSPYPYALKHNPFAYLGGCGDNVVPLDALDADLAGDTPSFVWITPGLCHDGHDCSADVSGRWLDGLVSRIVASPAWNDNGVLFVVWDEGNGGDANVVPLIAIASGSEPRESDAAYDHYSLLATIEDLFEVSRLGEAANATPMFELLPAALQRP